MYILLQNSFNDIEGSQSCVCHVDSLSTFAQPVSCTSASLVVDCKSWTLGWIPLSLPECSDRFYYSLKQRCFRKLPRQTSGRRTTCNHSNQWLKAILRQYIPVEACRAWVRILLETYIFILNFFDPFPFLTAHRSPSKWNQAWPFTCSYCCFKPEIRLIIQGIYVYIAAE